MERRRDRLLLTGEDLPIAGQEGSSHWVVAVGAVGTLCCFSGHLQKMLDLLRSDHRTGPGRLLLALSHRHTLGGLWLGTPSRALEEEERGHTHSLSIWGWLGGSTLEKGGDFLVKSSIGYELGCPSRQTHGGPPGSVCLCQRVSPTGRLLIFALPPAELFASGQAVVQRALN